jgi:hypothetical protein
MKTNLLSRYPGVSPFSSSQQGLFFGRKDDIFKLSSLILRNQQVLLYAKSGLGKSSLINAGIIPHLRKEQPDLHCIKIRFGTYTGEQSLTPVQQIITALQTLAFPADYAPLNLLFANEDGLWSHFKARQLANPKSSFLLIFDQFEELFSYPEEDIFRFKKQMNDLLYRNMPEHFRKALTRIQQKTPELLLSEATELLHEPQQVKTLLSIREDRYSLLNQLTDYLPDVMHYRYGLLPLDLAQVREAVELPAKQDADDYISKPFDYAPKALDKILDYLTKSGTQSVETTQLQILCSRIEQLNRPIIEAQDIPDFKNIFSDYYFNCLAQLPPTTPIREVRYFVERQLIQRGQRISFDALLMPDFINDKVLQVLVQEHHLLRAERNSIGGIAYELSHDTLVEPILEACQARENEELANKNRLEAEAIAAKARAEVKAAKLKAAQQREQLRTTRLLLFLALIALGGAVIATWWAFAAQSTAKAAQTEAENTAKKLIDKEDSLIIAIEQTKKINEELKQNKDSLNKALNETQNERKATNKANQIAQTKANEAAEFRIWDKVRRGPGLRLTKQLPLARKMLDEAYIDLGNIRTTPDFSQARKDALQEALDAEDKLLKKAEAGG